MTFFMNEINVLLSCYLTLNRFISLKSKGYVITTISILQVGILFILFGLNSCIYIIDLFFTS